MVTTAGTGAVIFIVKNALTMPKLNQVKLLHSCLGHLAPPTIRAILASGVDNGTSAKPADVNNHL